MKETDVHITNNVDKVVTAIPMQLQKFLFAYPGSAVLAGGAIRDAYRGIPPRDFDVFISPAISLMFVRKLLGGQYRARGPIQEIKIADNIPLVQVIVSNNPLEEYKNFDFTVNRIALTYSNDTTAFTVFGSSLFEQHIAENKLSYGAPNNKIRLSRSLQRMLHMLNKGFTISPEEFVKAIIMGLASKSYMSDHWLERDELVQILLSLTVPSNVEPSKWYNTGAPPTPGQPETIATVREYGGRLGVEVFDIPEAPLPTPPVQPEITARNITDTLRRYLRGNAYVNPLQNQPAPPITEPGMGRYDNYDYITFNNNPIIADIIAPQRPAQTYTYNTPDIPGDIFNDPITPR